MKPDIVPEVMFDNFRGRVCVVWYISICLVSQYHQMKTQCLLTENTKSYNETAHWFQLYLDNFEYSSNKKGCYGPW